MWLTLLLRGSHVQLVEKIVIISSDEEVLNYVSVMNVDILKENGKTDLNGALHQAIDYGSKSCDSLFIIPSDVPLIKKNHVKDILKLGDYKQTIT